MKAFWLLLICLGAAVQAPAQLTLFGFTKNVAVTYDSAAGVTYTGTVTVRHKGAATPFFLTFSAGSSGSFANRQMVLGGVRLNYQVYDNTGVNVLKDLSASPAASEVLSGTLPASANFQQQSFSYRMVIPVGQFVGAGLYTDTVTVNLYSGTLAAATLTDNNSVNYKVTVNSILQLSLVNTGSAFNFTSTSRTLDFGILQAGQSQSLDTVVRANVSYTLTIQSTNGSVLALAGAPDTIPYSLRFNGSLLTLAPATPLTLMTGRPATTSVGVSYPVNVTIGTLTDPSAGTYSDALLLTLTTP